jgi:hypothetical protein
VKNAVVLTTVLVLAALWACTAPPEPPPASNQNPVAAFSSATPSIKAGEPLLFTSTSSDPDGGAMT